MKKSLLLLLFLSVSIVAQQHPIAIESATLLEKGHAQIEGGTSYFNRQTYPLSGLTGNLTKIGNIRFSISLSEFVELQTDGTLLNLLSITHRDSAFNSIRTTKSNPTGDIGDFSVWTKFGLFNEYRDGIGFAVRFGVQLPNASNEAGLGVDEMNFYSSLLIQKHFGGKWTANLGLGILTDPTVLGQQHDVFIYGIEYFLPVAEKTYLSLQTAGRNGHSGIGIERLANGKIGLEQQFNNFAVKLFSVINFAPSDNARGVELTLSYLFHVVEIKQ